MRYFIVTLLINEYLRITQRQYACDVFPLTIKRQNRSVSNFVQNIDTPVFLIFAKMSSSQGDSETPNSTPIKTPKRPRKPKAVDKDSQGRKALGYFHEIGLRIENGEHKIYYECDLCHLKRNGNNLSNLASHLKHCHGDIYNEIFNTSKEDIAISRLRLLQDCVSIIALGGRPFTAITDYGFQRIISNQLNEFKKAGCPLDLNDTRQKDVHKYLHDAANLVRKDISDAIKNRPISVQVDVGSRLGRSLLGIDVQYGQKSNIIIHNIGMIVLDKSHTGENLSEVYRSCLNRYNIERKQIVSVTGDNAKNMQKMIRIEEADESPDDEQPAPKKKVSKRLEFPEMTNLYESPVQDDQTTRQINSDIEKVLQTDELSDENALNAIFEDCDISLNDDPNPYDSQHNNLLATVMTQAVRDHGEEMCFKLKGIKCAEHTVQLSVKDSLKALPEDSKNVITLARRVAKVLRLDSTKHLIAGYGLKLKKPKLDVETRWGSTYVMVSFLLIIIQ